MHTLYRTLDAVPWSVYVLPEIDSQKADLDDLAVRYNCLKGP